MAGNIVNLGDGRYRLRYKDESKYIKAKNDSTAERLLAKFVTDIDSGDFTRGSKVTFKEFIKKWLKEYGEVELAPKTVFRYKQLLDARILKVFGEKKLDKIKPLDLVEFYNSLRKDHKYLKLKKDGTREEVSTGALSEQTIKHHHRLMSALFEKAIKWEVLKGKNPAHSVDAPKTEKKKAKCYNEEQTQAMLDALQDEELKYKIITMLSLTTGARIGEVMGLEWQDIYDKSKIIEIRQSRQYLPGQGVFTKSTKNESSTRRVSVNKSVFDLLEEYKADQQSKSFLCQDNNPLFVTWDGKPMHPYTFTKWFPDFLAKHKLPHLNVHGLRHTSATYLIGQGVDIQTVAGRLGHSTSATTQNIYSHFLESKDKKAADMMEKSFGKKKTKRKTKKGAG